MLEIIEQDLDKEVLECQLPVFACFTTEWCHSCYPTCLFADQLAEEYDGRIKFVRLDTEKSPEIAERYHVIAVPAILVFKDRKPVKKLLGFQDRKSLRALLNNVTNESNRLPNRKLETNEAQS